MQHIDGPFILRLSETLDVSVTDILKVVYDIPIDSRLRGRITSTALDMKNPLPTMHRTHDRSLLIVAQGNVVDDYSGGVLRGIESAANDLGYDGLVHWQNVRENLLRYYKPLFDLGFQGDGTIFLTQDNLDMMLGLCAKYNARYVIGDCDKDDDLGIRHPVIGIDNQHAMQQAVSHLFELGHQRIGFITGALSVTSARARLDGYKQALQVVGLRVIEDLIAEGDWRLDGGRWAAAQLLELAERPTAIIVSNDIMAVGALLSINQAKLAIPADVALVGFDDISMASTVSPTLTTLRQPLEQLGCAAVEMLDEMIEQDTRYVPGRFFEAELIVREST